MHSEHGISVVSVVVAVSDGSVIENVVETTQVKQGCSDVDIDSMAVGVTEADEEYEVVTKQLKQISDDDSSLNVDVEEADNHVNPSKQLEQISEDVVDDETVLVVKVLSENF